MKTNVGWHFDNSYMRLPTQLYCKISPVPVSKPRLILLNHSLSDNLGLNFNPLTDAEIALQLSGNELPNGVVSLAQAYAGDQFGHFNMLGDGRVVLLGEHLTPENHRVDVQLKGSGQTPYSRSGDGRAALGPMLREYIISEAMHGLGIPTTRSLAVIATGEPVYRERVLQGAILVRIAASHIRVGTFQYVAMLQDPKLLETFLRYTVDRHYLELASLENLAEEFLKAVVKSQAKLITEWMRIGFIHGVMNTDNMAISGQTIDYGPCAFMDNYHPDTVFSSIDRHGRYAFDNQAAVGHWNLSRLAQALLPLLHPQPEKAVAIAQDVIDSYKTHYQNYWFEMMRKKIGLMSAEVEDKPLIKKLLLLMQSNQMDYTNTFLYLSERINLNDQTEVGAGVLSNWISEWKLRLDRNNGAYHSAVDLMRAINPVVIPRNHNVERALEAATTQHDLEPTNKLLKALSNPYEIQPEHWSYQSPPPAGEPMYQTFCGT